MIEPWCLLRPPIVSISHHILRLPFPALAWRGPVPPESHRLFSHRIWHCRWNSRFSWRNSRNWMTVIGCFALQIWKWQVFLVTARTCNFPHTSWTMRAKTCAKCGLNRHALQLVVHDYWSRCQTGKAGPTPICLALTWFIVCYLVQYQDRHCFFFCLTWFPLQCQLSSALPNYWGQYFAWNPYMFLRNDDDVDAICEIGFLPISTRQEL